MSAAPPLPRRRGAAPERVLPRTRRLLAWSLAGGFVLGYLVIWLLFFPGLGRAAIVTVPDLRGKALRDARGDAGDGGLAVVVGSTIPSPGVPAGHVVAQEPLPGQEVTRGAAVHLILSSGPTRRHVPDLSALDLDDARALLARYGFAVAVTAVLNPAPEGKLLAVAPLPGTEVPLPATVRLTVSAGPPKVAAPAIVGLTLGQAEARLDSAGLHLGRVSWDSAAVAALGSVEAQRPAEGDSVHQGGSVSVTVAGRPPAPLASPDSGLLGEPVEASQPPPPAPEGAEAARPEPPPPAPAPAPAPKAPAPRPSPARPPAAPTPKP